MSSWQPVEIYHLLASFWIPLAILVVSYSLILHAVNLSLSATAARGSASTAVSEASRPLASLRPSPPTNLRSPRPSAPALPSPSLSRSLRPSSPSLSPSPHRAAPAQRASRKRLGRSLSFAGLRRSSRRSFQLLPVGTQVGQRTPSRTSFQVDGSRRNCGRPISPLNLSMDSVGAGAHGGSRYTHPGPHCTRRRWGEEEAGCRS